MASWRPMRILLHPFTRSLARSLVRSLLRSWLLVRTGSCAGTRMYSSFVRSFFRSLLRSWLLVRVLRCVVRSLLRCVMSLVSLLNQCHLSLVCWSSLVSNRSLCHHHCSRVIAATSDNFNVLAFSFHVLHQVRDVVRLVSASVRLIFASGNANQS
jgi:hypothetical protein